MQPGRWKTYLHYPGHVPIIMKLPQGKHRWPGVALSPKTHTIIEIVTDLPATFPPEQAVISSCIAVFDTAGIPIRNPSR
jgi:hypothetical protein